MGRPWPWEALDSPWQVVGSCDFQLGWCPLAGMMCGDLMGCFLAESLEVALPFSEPQFPRLQSWGPNAYCTLPRPL